MRNTVDRYGTVARVLHWSMGLLLLGQILLGFWVFEFMEKSAERSALNAVHRALGVVLLILVLVRLAWRGFDAPPQLPTTMPERERKGTRYGHVGLYVLMAAMPVVGVLLVAYAGGSTDVFGMFAVPPFVEKSESLHDFFEDAHKVGAYALGVLILLHAAAAIRHKWFLKDGAADRML